MKFTDVRDALFLSLGTDDDMPIKCAERHCRSQ